MAFGLPSGSGDIIPFIKYNAKSGYMYRVDREQGASGWETTEVDITKSFSAVIDLDNIQIGYVYFGPNGPQRRMATYLKEPMPVCPPDKDDKGKALYKSGFSVLLALSKNCGGGIREFGSSANVVVTAMGVLHDEYMAAPERANGKLPVLTLHGVTAEKGDYGTNYRPQFAFSSWVDRPPSLTVGGRQSQQQPTPAPNGNGVQQRPAAPGTGSTVKEPPRQAVQQQVSSPVVAADDFG